MEQIVGGQIVEKVIPELWRGLKSKYKEHSFKKEEEFKIIYQKYLSYSYEKYSQIKTLLYSNEPQSIFSFYEPMKLSLNGSKGDLEDSMEAAYRKRKIIISGTGGIGKSMMMKKMYLDFIQQDTFIPVFVELKNTNGQSIEDLIFDALTTLHLRITIDEFRQTLEFGRYAFFFDGYDEVKFEFLSKLSKEIIDFSDKYNTNIYVVSSRPSDNFIGWQTFTRYDIEPLTKNQAISLLNKLSYHDEIKKQFIIEVEDKLFDTHQTFMEIPLLLTLMLMTYNKSATIPDDYTEFYSNCFSALFNQHDATKTGFRRSHKTSLGESRFKKILTFVAAQSYLKNEVDMTKDKLVKYINKFDKVIDADSFVDDAVNAVCMLILDGNTYKFSHRSFQEYFAGCYLIEKDDDFLVNYLSMWLKNMHIDFESERAFVDTLFSNSEERLFKHVLFPIVEEFSEKYSSYSVDQLIEEFIMEIKIDKEMKISGFSYDKRKLFYDSLSRYLSRTLGNQKELRFNYSWVQVKFSPGEYNFRSMDPQKKSNLISSISNSDAKYFVIGDILHLIQKKEIIQKKYFRGKEVLEFEI